MGSQKRMVQVRGCVPEKMIMSLFDGILSLLSLLILDRGTL